MSEIQEIPNGIDSFSEGLSSFETIEGSTLTPPTAAVESASFNVQNKKAVTITEPPTSEVHQIDSEEVLLSDNLKQFYDENQTIILVGIAVAVAYFFHTKKN